MLQKKKEEGLFPLLFFVRECRAVFFLFSYSDYSFISDSFAYRQSYYTYICKYVFIQMLIYTNIYMYNHQSHRYVDI